jgi:hypothetical protein
MRQAHAFRVRILTGWRSIHVFLAAIPDGEPALVRQKPNAVIP